jgi:hypothetical protein
MVCSLPCSSPAAAIQVLEGVKTVTNPLTDPERSTRATRRPRRNAVGEDRPAFLLDFPDDSELEPLIQAFETGNFREVRARAAQVAEHTKDPKVRAAALELRRRTDPDPLLITLLAVCLALFCFLVIWVYARHE